MAAVVVNEIEMAGFVQRTPEMRYTQSGMGVASFTLRIPAGRKNDKPQSVFLDVTFFDSKENKAEHLARVVAEGQNVRVTGRLVQDEWVDKETGKKRTKIKAIASEWAFVGDDFGKPAEPKAASPVSEAEDEALPF